MQHNAHPASVQERIQEAMREIGVLFLTFAPLEVSLGGSGTHHWIVLVTFVVAGISLFCGALILARRNRDAD